MADTDAITSSVDVVAENSQVLSEWQINDMTVEGVIEESQITAEITETTVVWEVTQNVVVELQQSTEVVAEIHFWGTGPQGDDGREVEIQVGGGYIQWRYVGDEDWINLILVSTLTGPPGDPGEPWDDGADGTEVELQNSGTYIQWRYVGSPTWINLIALADITWDDGAPGDDGREIELQKTDTHIQWRYVGEVSWTNLVALADITGPPWAPGDPATDTKQVKRNSADTEGYLNPQLTTGVEGIRSVIPVGTVERLTNGGFTGNANSWSLASGFVYSSNTVVKNANGVGALTQASGSMVTPLVTEELLTLTYTLSNFTAGTVTPSIGGITLTTRSTAGTYTETFRITSTAQLAFTPSNTARFTIDNVSLMLAYSGGETKAVHEAAATSTYSHYSPPVEWEAQGWSSNSSVSRVVKFRSYLKTSISSPNPIGKWILEHQTNNGNWTAALEYDNSQVGKGFRISTPTAQSNSTPGTTRAVSIENTGSYTHIDMNFSGVTKAAYSANSSGDAIVYTTGSFYVYGGSGSIGSLFNLHQLGSFGAYITGVGAFTGRVSAGYGTTTPKNYLQTAGSFGGYGRYVTSNTYTVVDQDFWIYCDTTNANACTGTPSSACSSYSNSTDCGNHSVAGCSWNGGNCSDYNGNQGTCEGTSGCTWEMVSCNGIGDESSCNGTSGCSWNNTPNDCAPYNSDQMTCEGHSGCMWTAESLSDCSTFNNNEGGCTGSAGCSWSPSYDIDCPSTYFDESSCNAVSGCSWDGMTCNGMGYGGNGSCSGMYVSTPASCSGTWYTYLCEGNYSTGNCTGVWGTCTGTASCSPFSSQSPCEAETGCTWSSGQTIYLPQLSAISDNNIGRVLKIKKFAGAGNVVITAYTGDNIGGNPTATLSTIGTDFELHGYTINGDCSIYNNNEGSCTWASGCNWASTCSGYSNEWDCTGNGCSWDSMAMTCSGGSAGTCSGNYVISKRWHIWGA